MNTFLKSTCRILVSGFVVAALAPATFAQEVDPEWPCIQRLILEVSPAVMWPIPVEEGMVEASREDPQIRALAEELGDIEVFNDSHRQSIADFVQNTPEAELENQLTTLAAGIVGVSNGVRGDYIRGIKRYTRQQIAISEQIEDTLNELSLLEGESIASNGQSRQEIEETLRWHERVYDQRERNIQLLCEAPVELEQRLSEVLRDAAQYLP